MPIEKKDISVSLKWYPDESNPEKGEFWGGVIEPLFLDELEVWVENEIMFDDEIDDFNETGNHRIGIFGSRRSLYELGKFFLGLATYHTKDPKHYQYLEGLEVKDGFKPCKFFVRLPNEPELKIKNGKVIVSRKKK